MTLRILTTNVHSELDVVAARQRARQIAGICGFGTQDQVRIATAVSELARNVYNYARNGKIEFAVEGETSPQILAIRITDQGPGIAHIDVVLSGTYQSSTGMGVGIIGARRLMDRFDIQTGTGGTEILLQKLFPKDAPILTLKTMGALSSQLTALPANVTLSEVQQQNQELLGTLAELKTRQEELLQLTRELEDTNRGVVALYAELDEKADHLRRADDMKSRFLSNMSHEFRTPLNSIRALSKLLLEHVDGDLTVEQEKQVKFIHNGAIALSELVNDLLDIAKIEAGKVDVRPVKFDVKDMFSALRGMLRPLLVSEKLTLTFEQMASGIELYTDEAKLSQILRNFISNALKFTEAGEIVVSATLLEEGLVKFSVSDTGVGIAEDHLQLIFEEFSQVENHLQSGVKGTGLGLPLCRNLSSLLGGYVTVESSLGMGSIFSVVIPLHFAQSDLVNAVEEVIPSVDEGRLPVLVVEDDPQIRFIYEKFLSETEFRTVWARNLREADELWISVQPAAVILDIMLKGEDSWRWLAVLKQDDRRKHIPVIVATEVEDKRKGLSLGADAYYLKPLLKEDLLSTLYTVVKNKNAEMGQSNGKS